MAVGITRIFRDIRLEEVSEPRGYVSEELIARLKALEPRAAMSAEPGKRLSRQQKIADTAVADRSRAILATAVEGIITINERGIIESVNASAERIFGYSAKEITGRNISVLMASPHRDAHDGYIGNYLRTGTPKIIGFGREVAGRRKNGTIFPMYLSVSEAKIGAQRLFTGFIRDITERKRLEREILEISDREQRRVGHDLHDGLCQHLAGIEIMSQVLAKKLGPKSKAHAKQVMAIANHVREAITHTRSLARGLSPVTIESEGLTSALIELATNTEKIHHAQCRCEFDEPVAIYDHAVATHLFRIAQEAVANAVKHGRAQQIVITLRNLPGRITLDISDNGNGLRKQSNQKGMGLRIMQSRANMIGGTLAIESNAKGGVSVTCAIPEDSVVPKSANYHARKV